MDERNVGLSSEEPREEAEKYPVMGSKAARTRWLFLLSFAAATAVLTVLAVQLPKVRSVLLIVMAVWDVLSLILSWAVPAAGCFDKYRYSLSVQGVTLYRADEEVMTMPWTETEVSLGSYIVRGNESDPRVCAPAICFARRGYMRRPQRFPKRAMKGAAGELCTAFSKQRLREVYRCCGGNIAEDITADGCRLSKQDTELMLSALHKLREREAQEAAAREAREQREAAAQAAREQKEAARAQREAAKAEKKAAARSGGQNGSEGDDSGVL